jgi:hypothetical protein
VRALPAMPVAVRRARGAAQSARACDRIADRKAIGSRKGTVLVSTIVKHAAHWTREGQQQWARAATQMLLWALSDD